MIEHVLRHKGLIALVIEDVTKEKFLLIYLDHLYKSLTLTLTTSNISVLVKLFHFHLFVQ